MQLSPCYIIEEKKLRQNLEKLAYVQYESNAQIICALKAFSMYHVFPIMSEYLSGVTASSINEYKLAREFFGKEIHVYCPAYTTSSFTQIVPNSGYLSFNSWSQYRLFGKQVPSSVHIGMRINPEYGNAISTLYDPCAKGSRLGVPLKSLPKSLPKKIDGIHIHSLCESQIEGTIALWEQLEKHIPHYLERLNWINLGGGHLITHDEYEVDKLISLLQHIQKTYDLKVFLEPGSAVVWQTGSLHTRVLDVVVHHGVRTAMIDSSFAAHMPDCLEIPYKPKIRTALEEGKYTYKIGGATCLASDVMGDYHFDKELKIGDSLVFEDMMHYTMVKNNSFNGVEMPSIAMKKLNGELEVFKQFGYEDYKSKL